MAYQLIDGNWSHYPFAYCKRKKGWLTVGLAEIHKCKEKKCSAFEESDLIES